jgi:hypothetical protein
METKNLISSLLCSLFVFTGQQAYANTYFLNQSNTLTDGVNYAQVDVLENGGNLNFTVSALNPTNWKFSNFYFNLGGATGDVTLTGLPSGWSADTDLNVSTFGLFSDGTRGTGSNLHSIFSFTADGTNPLSFANLIANGEGWLFAAHSQCQDKRDNPCSAVDGLTSHQIAGPGVSPVPIPGAIWLFGTALMGFISMSNRRKV